MTVQKSLPVTLLLFLVSLAPLLAHHSVAGEYDTAKSTTIQGLITKVEWKNPHVWITLESKNSNGSIRSWRVEIGAPNALFREGIPRESFELSKPCSIEVWPAREGSQTASGRKLTFADGKMFDVSDKWPSVPAINPPAK